MGVLYCTIRAGDLTERTTPWPVRCDIRWAIEHALAASDVDTNLDADVAAVLYLGPDTHGDLLEVVVIEDDAGDEIVIDAMKFRRQYRRLLPGGGAP